MTKFKLVGVALVLSAIQLTPAWAQVSEPAAAEARDPNFSIYSNYPGGVPVSSFARDGADAARRIVGTADVGAAASRAIT